MQKNDLKKGMRVYHRVLRESGIVSYLDTRDTSSIYIQFDGDDEKEVSAHLLDLCSSSLSKNEFEEQYAKRSNVTVKWLHEQDQEAVPCDCNEEGCLGWKIVQRSIV